MSYTGNRTSGGMPSVLDRALLLWQQTDDMGGFKAVAAMLFPGWFPSRSCRAPHREDRAASFSIFQEDAGEWRFKDFATGDGGTLVGFVMLAGMQQVDAARWLIEKSSTCAVTHAAPDSLPRRVATTRHADKLPPMPSAAIAAWNEGVDHIAGSREAIERLAQWRGWPLRWAQHLVDTASVSMPLYHGKRTLAFLVAVPEGHRNQMTMRNIGFHCRLAPEGDEKASWRFMPNQREHNQSTPALPYIIGGSWFDSARLIVIAGGQWDALTFAFAAGWLGDEAHWPDGVCAVGLRGDSSTAAFFKAYDQFWPHAANCLLLPDDDASGLKWFQGTECFAVQLQQRCRKVAVVSCAPHKDFNELYRAGAVASEQIAELLASHGMAVESGVPR